MTDSDDTARIVDSEIGASEVREYVTIHDSVIGDGCGIYERTSIKKAHLADEVDVNTGSYVENAEIGPRVQIGPNSSVVGITHELRSDGMEYRDDVFERIVLDDGVFLGAGAVVGPGVEIGPNSVVAAGATVVEDVAAHQLVLGSPPTQEIVSLSEWCE